jgi:molybdopterin synthase catalytic subunit
MFSARVQTADIDVGAETETLRHAAPEAGALANFLGIVRSTANRPITALTLEHYPGMTDAALDRIGREAIERFALLGCTIIHRVGTLRPGDAIVLVLTAARHRRAALDATAFLIDWLKTDAPFWKKEHLPDGAEAWVEARAEDDHAAARWNG